MNYNAFWILFSIIIDHICLFLVLWATPSSAHSLLLGQYSGLIPGGLKGPYGIQEIKLGRMHARQVPSQLSLL